MQTSPRHNYRLESLLVSIVCLIFCFLLLIYSVEAQKIENSLHQNSDLASNINPSTFTTTRTTMDAPKAQSPLIKLRKSLERGHANFGWLNSYHTFSFANYYDPKFQGFGSLRVINEDRVEGSQGFDTHPHANYEIFSYIVNGALRHKDSMGNTEVIERGGVQFTSAGTGIYHSEFNADRKKEVHFIQMWVKPHTKGLKPSYSTRVWSDEQKLNQLRKMISPDGSDETIKINQHCSVYASILEKDKSVEFSVGDGRQVYVHLIQTSPDSKMSINGETLSSGDGAFITGSGKLDIKGESEARSEFILFDLVAEE